MPLIFTIVAVQKEMLFYFDIEFRIAENVVCILQFLFELIFSEAPKTHSKTLSKILGSWILNKNY